MEATTGAGAAKTPRATNKGLFTTSRKKRVHTQKTSPVRKRATLHKTRHSVDVQPSSFVRYLDRFRHYPHNVNKNDRMDKSTRGGGGTTNKNNGNLNNKPTQAGSQLRLFYLTTNRNVQPTTSYYSTPRNMGDADTIKTSLRSLRFCQYPYPASPLPQFARHTLHA